ncbi:MAG: choice-of-anchor J domain-containing protein, partial [Candidatus Cloacimonetes bacterium]|nr:choice-of-anchor J domain-containing protein [Candidatus Cloacimonadota bacterium]
FSRGTTPGIAFDGVGYAAKGTSKTAVYVLSTPLSVITANSTLDFYTSSALNTTQIIQAVYSTDRINWTQIGPNITQAVRYQWYRSTIDLSSLAGNNYYLGFRSPAQIATGTINIDHVFGPEIALEAPGQVSLTSPINGFGAVIVQPTLVWTTNTTTGGVPTEYKVYLDTNADPTTLVATVPTLSYTFPTPLNPTTLYYWKVIASNSAGDAPPSAIRSFTTTVNPPLAATNPSPMDTATGVAVNATLSWDAMANTSYYKLYFGTTLPTTATANIVANSWTPPLMTGGATYYWKVVPFHTTAGEAVNNQTWSFTTDATPPPIVTNPYPAEAAVNVAINAALSWTASPGATSYDVYFGTTLPGTANATVTSASWTPPLMTNDTTYQWMVVPVNNNGSPTNNATWSFTTIVALPQAAVNPVPLSGSFNVATNASLAWDAVAGASSYDVYFGTTLPAIITASVSTPSWTPPVMANATVYQWKVIPRNIAGGASGAVTWSFTTVTALPLAATNPNPADGSPEC